MIPLTALLALALAAGPSDPPRRAALDPSNAARARAGLLPRKAARPRTQARDEHGRRIITVRVPAPTYLAEPAPLADPGSVVVTGPLADDDDAIASSGGSRDPQRGVPAPELIGARGPTEVTRLQDAPAAAPGRVGAGEPEGAAGAVVTAEIEPPEELGTVRAALAGVVTDVILRMRFDP